MMGFGFGGFGLIFMLIFWVVIIGLALWLLSSLFPQATRSTSLRMPAQQTRSVETSLEILKQRYARGEISKSEYEQMRQDLEK